MLNQCEIVSGSVDRLMDMDTYQASSMEDWLIGDIYDLNGFYNFFINDYVPRDKCTVGMGGWPANCSLNDGMICWSSKPESGPPRIERLIKDNVTEIAFFRFYGNVGGEWPQEWWWELIEKYIQS